MELAELIKVYGPMAIGWVIAGWLIKEFLQRNAADIESRVKLAVALEGLTNTIKEALRGKN